MVYYILKDISPLKVEISKLLFEEKQKMKNNAPNLINPSPFQKKNDTKSENSRKSKKSRKKNDSKSVKGFPPKKKGNIKAKSQRFNSNLKNNKNEITLIDVDKKEGGDVNIKTKNEEGGNINQDRLRRRKSIADLKAEMGLETYENLLHQKTSSELGDEKGKKEKKVMFKEKDEDKKRSFDNYELNNMEYYDASKYDKRSCLKTYWSVLKREHYLIFTFISRNDYNLFYIKIERFFILICTEVTMNGMFFVHETMYKKQTGDTSFAQKIPQIIFSLLVTHAVEILLCYLSMTDKSYYKIKAIPQKEKNEQKVFDILDCMRKKLIGFFIFTFLFFLFHWYFISAFCAVYQNTQLIYLRDSAISILVSLIDPFIVYGINCLLRALSLAACCRKKMICIYKLSDVLPLF